MTYCVCVTVREKEQKRETEKTREGWNPDLSQREQTVEMVIARDSAINKAG